MSERVGPYELVRRLGRGGMGEVWLARTVHLGGLVKTVALKLVVLDSEAPSEEFLREARVSLLLAHSNVVSVFDAGVADCRGYLAMEWIDGVDLAQILAVERSYGAGALPESVALFVLREILRALAYVHELAHEGRPLGLVHRDISPSNVLVSRSGEVKVTDFGIARSRLAMSSDGGPKGKLRYMAPEQFAGRGIDARADLYAVGAILHEMLEGRPLRTGESAPEVVAEIADARESALGVLVSPVTHAIYRWLLAPDPSMRAPSAAAVLDYLQTHCAVPDAAPALAQRCQAISGRRQPSSGSELPAVPESATRDGESTLGPATTATRTSPGTVATAHPTPHGSSPRHGAALVGMSSPRRSRGAAALAIGVAAGAAVLAAGTATWLATRDHLPAVWSDGITILRGGGDLLSYPCPLDHDGDGVLDVVGWRMLDGSGDRWGLVIHDGHDGSVAKALDREVRTPQALTCLAPSRFSFTLGDDIELWSTADLEKPSLVAAKSVTADDWLEGVGTTIAELTVDTEQFAVAREPSGDSLEVRKTGGTQPLWRRTVDLVHGGQARLVVTSDRVWTFGRLRNTQQVRLVGLDRFSGAPLVDVLHHEDARIGFPLFAVYDGTNLLVGTGAGACAHDPSSGEVRWCVGVK